MPPIVGEKKTSLFYRLPEVELSNLSLASPQKPESIPISHPVKVVRARQAKIAFHLGGGLISHTARRETPTAVGNVAGMSNGLTAFRLGSPYSISGCENHQVATPEGADRDQLVLGARQVRHETQRHLGVVVVPTTLERSC